MVDLSLAIQESDKTQEVDMGSVFDLFSPISHDEPPYVDEWWHFSMKSVPNPSGRFGWPVPGPVNVPAS
jgi:D-alanyl-D-alanine dipeptidase